MSSLKMNHPSTFKIINKKSSNTPVTSYGVIHMRLLKKYLNKKELVERSLIVNCILSFSIYLIRSNLIKSFDLDRSSKMALREKLLPLGNKYYNDCIRLLRLSITKTNLNSELALVVSELLNRVSLLEFRTLENCLVFNNGVITIIQNLISNERFKSIKSYPPDLQVILKFFTFAGNSISFPGYRHDVLYEILAYLDRFRETFRHKLKSPENCLVRFRFNHLISYIQKLVTQLETTKNFSDDQLFNILRSWVISLPTEIPIVDSIRNPMQYIVLTFYKSVSLVLNSIFPSVNAKFLMSFTGDLKVFNVPDYNVHFKSEHWNSGYTHQETAFIKEQWDYFTRLHTFFNKRYNTLSVLFNYLNFGSLWRTIGTDNRKMTTSYVLSRINEVPIHRFSETLVHIFHFPHIAYEIDFSQIRETNTISPGQLDSMENPYVFNTFHWDMIRGKYRARFFENGVQEAEEAGVSSKRSMSGAIQPTPPKVKENGENFDPVFDYMFGNFINASDQEVVDLNTEIFGNFIDSVGYLRCLSRDYFAMINSRLGIPGAITLNESTGLDYRDRDVIDYVYPNFDFIAYIDNTFETFHFNNFFKNLQCLRQPQHEELVDEDDLTEKFYDDLNETYFR